MKNDIISKISDYLTFKKRKIKFKKSSLIDSFDQTILDLNYHYPSLTSEEVYSRILNNGSELATFIYRLGNNYYKIGDKYMLDYLHGLMRLRCSCEIYFSNSIDIGFYVTHSVGIVIGSRNIIKKGFLIYQNCTVGHNENDEDGSKIGKNVSMLPYSSIIGNIKIGDNVVFSAYSSLRKNVASNLVLSGVPAKILKYDSSEIQKKIRPNN